MKAFFIQNEAKNGTKRAMSYVFKTLDQAIEIAEIDHTEGFVAIFSEVDIKERGRFMLASKNFGESWRYHDDLWSKSAYLRFMHHKLFNASCNVLALEDHVENAEYEWEKEQNVEALKRAKEHEAKIEQKLVLAMQKKASQADLLAATLN